VTRKGSLALGRSSVQADTGGFARALFYLFSPIHLSGEVSLEMCRLGG
jgi:hypothetical protein